MHHLNLKTPNLLLHIETLSILIFKFNNHEKVDQRGFEKAL